MPVPCAGGSLSVVCDSDYGYKTWQLNVQNTMEWRGDNWENFLTYGWQTSLQNRKAVQWLDDGTRLPDARFHPQGTDLRTGVFVQNEFIWDDRLTIIPGIRLDWHRISPEGVLNPPTAPPCPSSEHLALMAA